MRYNKTIHRIARGRRYGVTSDGNKFHGLYHQACMKEREKQEAQKQRRQRQEEEVKQVPWNYEEQNRANAELLLGLSANMGAFSFEKKSGRLAARQKPKLDLE